MVDYFGRLLEIISQLRGEAGCPWDREQTPTSLRPFLIEEAYEVLEAMDRGDPQELKEELGDLLFQILFHAQIAKENGQFDIDGVLQSSVEKMTRRHPHVFQKGGAPKDLTAQAVLLRWEDAKRAEDRNLNRRSVLDGIPKSLPALHLAQQIQNRAARVGFDWKTPTEVRENVLEEWEEFSAEVDRADLKRMEEEFGDLLFSLVNYARHLQIQPEEALRKATARFSERFSEIEQITLRNRTRISDLPPEEIDRLWEETKERLGKKGSPP